MKILPGAAAAAPENPIGIIAVSGMFSFLFNKLLSSDTSSKLSVAIWFTIVSNLGFAGLSLPSGTGIESFSPAAACACTFFEIVEVLTERELILSKFNIARDFNILSIAL